MFLLSILLIVLFATGLWLAVAHLGALSYSPWLLAHIASAVAAYVLFASAVVCAWFFLRYERNLKTNITASPRVPLLTLERRMFGCIYAGFLLLSLSLCAGAIAGGSGFILRPQHKTIFATLAWLCFGVLIAGRWLLGWRGQQAIRITYSGSVLLLLAYVGTRFVLDVILQR